MKRVDYRPFGAFRFALALMVLLQHGLLVLGPHGQALFYHLELGAVAVAVFFALSGFIVAEACAQFYSGRPGAFLLNRALRIAPPYLAALALAVLVDCALYPTRHLVPLGDALSGAPWQPRVVLSGVLELVPGLSAARISGQSFSFIPFAWSLRVEFTFYLALAALFWLARQNADRLMRAHAGQIEGALAALCLGTALFVAHRAAGLPTLAVNIPFFSFGVCAYLMREGRGFMAWRNLSLIGASALAAFPFCGQRGQPVLAFQLPLLAALFCLLLALRQASLPAGRWQQWDAALGRLSYPLYVGHGVALTLVASLLPQRGVVPYALAIGLSLLLAAALHGWVERPMASLRTHVRGVALFPPGGTS